MAICLTSWTATAKVVRAKTEELCQQPFIKIEETLGQKKGYIMLRHNPAKYEGYCSDAGDTGSLLCHAYGGQFKFSWGWVLMIRRAGEVFYTMLLRKTGLWQISTGGMCRR